MKKTLLIIEDDPNITELIKLYAEQDNFRVISSDNGQEGLERALQIKPDLIVLDRMLPELEGLEVLKKLRQEQNTPVLIVSAKADEFERILGLELGADDYIPKPFSPKELMARVKAVLRRQTPTEQARSQTLEAHGLTLDPEKMSVTQKQTKAKSKSEMEAHIELTAIEFKLLYTLAEKPGTVFSREQLMESIYDSSHSLVYDRTVDAHIKKIRKKLGDKAKTPKYIESVFGVGYKFKE